VGVMRPMRTAEVYALTCSRCGKQVEIPCRPPYRCPQCGAELVIVWRTEERENGRR
jgi:DNA-directed RNA polymerase subunit RPC12/RpoP